jgi:YHS domain-containing protein
VRGGASSGEVILLEGDDYIGNTVNLAARLCDIAEGGEVLADPEIAASVPRWGTVRSVDQMAVRGLGDAVAVARLGFAALQPPTRPDPVCGIPLDREVAEERAFDAYGNEVWFCSDSCRDTWEHRPKALPEGQGSLRTPLIGT